MQKEVVVTGVKHYKGINAFDVDMEVVVEFDGENPYSNNAFKVLDGGNVQLGSVAENPSYIPRKICSEITILAKELKQLVNDGFTIVGAVVKDIVRNYAILTVELKEPTVDEIKDEDVVVLPIEAKESIYTVVGTKYHSANANVGDIVRFKVVNGTTTLYDMEDNSIGVLPQSDKKVKELQEIGAPIVLNQFARTDFYTLENVFVVSYVVENKYVFLRELEEDDLKEEKGDETMVKTELKDVNVVVECGEPQFAIGSDKIIGYDEIAVCGSCESSIGDDFKFCSQCGERVREEITSSQSTTDDDNGDDEMNVEIVYGTNYKGDVIKYDEIPFKEHYGERISRFEQSDVQRENGECTIVTYYASTSFGTSRDFTMKLTKGNVEYIKSVIPHNQVKEGHIDELYEQLDNLIAHKGEFDPYWVDLYRHQTDYTTFQTDDGKVYQVIGRGDKNIDYHHKVIRNVEIEYRGQCPHNLHFWKAIILE